MTAGYVTLLPIRHHGRRYQSRPTGCGMQWALKTLRLIFRLLTMANISTY